MHEMISVVALFFGIPLFLTGWIWGIVAARNTRVEWVVGMTLLFPATLPLFAMVHWAHAKWPLLLTIIATALIMLTMYYVPAQ